MFFCVLTGVNAQDAGNDPSKFLPNITPPSPEAFKFSMYGNTPVGMFTGTPNINLPLFNYKTANLSIPYNLSYSSSGLKVDEINTKTGLGWNLIGGGVITRIVRNLEDDYFEDFPMKHLDITTVPESVMKNVYFYLFGENQGKDSERDIFIFNFPNNSGKFYLDNNNKIVFLEKSDIKVELIPVVGGGMYTFIITTTDGVKYYFQETEQTMLRTYGASHADPSIKTTAWYLNKIVHPKGDEIYFTYSNVTENYVQSQSQQASKAFPIQQTCASGQSYTKGITFGPIYEHNIRITGKTLNSISSNNPSSGSVAFSYEDKISNSEPGNVIKTITIKNKAVETIEKIDFDYLLTSNKRIFLNSFNFSEAANKYSFTYINPSDFPARLSKSQDHWGYFNGANNSTLLPRIEGSGFENFAFNAANREIDETKVQTGLLNKIIYPTKGYTELEYASNDYYGTKKVMPPTVNKELTLENDIEQRHMSTSVTFKADFSYEAKFTGGTYFANCDPANDTGGNHHKGYVTILCVEDGTYVPIFQYSDAYGTQVTPGVQSLDLTANSTIPYYFKVVQNKNYKVILVNDYTCTHSRVNLQYYVGAPQIINTNLLTGGCRVKSTKDYSLNNPTPVTKKYYYAKFDNLNVSSGDNFQVPYYLNYSDHPSYSGANDLSCTVTDAVLNSSSISSLFEMGSNVYYKYVTVSSGDTFENGYEENEFIINKDYREQIYIGDREFRNVPWSNLGWNNGKLLKTKIVEKQGSSYILRKEIINTYLKDANNPTLINFAIYNPAQGQFVNNTQEECLCTASNISKSYPVKYCSAIHIHQGDANGDCIASGADNVIFDIHHPCFGKTSGSFANIPTITHLDVMPYKYISYFVYLSNTTTNEYDKNGLNPITTLANYNYAGTNHLQLTSQSVTNSTTGLVGEVTETKYLYARDTQLAALPYINNLRGANIIGIPLNTQIFKGSTKISEQTTVYDKSTATNNLLLPKSIYSAKFPNALTSITTPSVGQLEKKITFDQYDSKGNITQYTLENGTSVSFIWGYDKTLPIAKIENATLAQIASALGITVAVLDTYSEAQANMSSLNGLRSNLLMVNCMITTFTHKPLVGISSVTDPKGDVMTYNYDSFNRLLTVRDRSNNILSENQYHYKN
ncbi:hypothetical protein ASD98_11195 [Flavobacterium sp. Root186]|nr:hypothetical protein ASD98_11195 [Flavobacterium sp. Root186]